MNSERQSEWEYASASRREIAAECAQVGDSVREWKCESEPLSASAGECYCELVLLDAKKCLRVTECALFVPSYIS